jgi:hypothetical protein
MPRRLLSTTAPIRSELQAIPVELSSEQAVPCGAYTIPQFARAHGFSEAMYHKLKRQGLAPVEMAVGTRRLISVEAAAAWRRTREGPIASAEP